MRRRTAEPRPSIAPQRGEHARSAVDGSPVCPHVRSGPMRRPARRGPAATPRAAEQRKARAGCRGFGRGPARAALPRIVAFRMPCSPSHRLVIGKVTAGIAMQRRCRVGKVTTAHVTPTASHISSAAPGDRFAAAGVTALAEVWRRGHRHRGCQYPSAKTHPVMGHPPPDPASLRSPGVSTRSLFQQHDCFSNRAVPVQKRRAPLCA